MATYDYTIGSNPSNYSFATLINNLGGNGSSVVAGKNYLITGSNTSVSIGNQTTENGGTITVSDGATLTFTNGVQKGTSAGPINVSDATLIYQSTNSGLNTAINITSPDGGGKVIFSANSATVTVYGYVAGTTEIEIANTTKQATATWNSSTGVTAITDGGIHFNISGNIFNIAKSGGTTLVGTSDGTNLIICFLAGSMIHTPSGELAVERLSVGDEIVAYVDGKEMIRRVTWAGQARCHVRPHLPDDEAGYPVRILENAIADGVPYKDMLITAEHCLFFDGKFVPVRMLVNSRSIFYDKSITSYDYYHIETENHSIIMADGMLTESYLDTGNRRAFRQAGTVVALTPSRNLTWNDAAAPLGVSRAFVEPLFREIAVRAEAAGWALQSAVPGLTDDADLHLITDTGAVIRQAREHNNCVMFMIPAGVQSVRLVSRASRPCDVTGPFVDDRRHFGVEVGEITIFEASSRRTVTAHLTEKELDGWNTLEREGERWTSGNAFLPLGEGRLHEVALITIQIKAAGPYVQNETIKEKVVQKA